MDAYKNKGNKQYETYGDDYRTYCTKNEAEMFAECYTFLMTNSCDSEGVIKKHFPKTLKEVKRLLGEARGLGNESRHIDNRIVAHGMDLFAISRKEGFETALEHANKVNINDPEIRARLYLSKGQPEILPSKEPPATTCGEISKIEYHEQYYGSYGESGASQKFDKVHGETEDGTPRIYYWINDKPVSYWEFDFYDPLSDYRKRKNSL